MVNAISSTNMSGANSMFAIQSAQPGTQIGGTTQSSSSAGSAASPSDTVQLSASAQAHAMQQQGMSVKTIASNLGITTKDVDSYLGITGATSGGGAGGGASQDAKIAAEVRVNP